MSTTPKKPHKHAEVLKAWAEGEDIYMRGPGDQKWERVVNVGDSMPTWEYGLEYCVKPEPAAPVYPETLATNREIYDAVPPAGGTPFSCIVDPKGWRNIRDLMNYAIRRAIDDGQVVPAAKTTHVMLFFGHTIQQWRQRAIDAETKLAGADVVDAEFDPDFHEVKQPEQRWMTNTAREWHEQYLDMSNLCEERGKKLARAVRALDRAGFEDRGGEEWAPPVNQQADTLHKLEAALTAAGFVQDGDGWTLPCDIAVAAPLSAGRRAGSVSGFGNLQSKQQYTQMRLDHAERVLKANGFTYSPDEGWSTHSDWRGKVLQEKDERISQLESDLKAARRAAEQYKGCAQRVGRAVAKHLNRSDITDHEIAAIVLLERAK